MPVDGITTPTPGTSHGPVSSVQDALGATSPTVTRNDQQWGKDTFLKLLVAQLRYQDPAEPAKGTEFLSQTASFTQVEKLEEIAKSTAAMLSAQTVVGTAGLVGRAVTYLDSDGAEKTGTVDAVSFTGSDPTLRVTTDGSTVDVPVGMVKEVRATAAA